MPLIHEYSLHTISFNISMLPAARYACEILRATDVACKSYKRKRSESSVTTIITIHEMSLRFRL